ncbi:hypothetical protein J2Z22_000658 [Paenibacillus forsythiae]|uniref:Transposase n=1 Tax=Paenibacillus forsythiae TaxID=365616 RepID=A0ABU3H5Z5_9BACL|nr:hypothetical protein [Paenibacillus forsythiae]
MKPNRDLPKNRLTPEKRVYFRPELTHCPDCGTKLKRHHTASHKIVATLNGILEAWNRHTTVRMQLAGKRNDVSPR